MLSINISVISLLDVTFRCGSSIGAEVFKRRQLLPGCRGKNCFDIIDLQTVFIFTLFPTLALPLVNNSWRLVLFYTGEIQYRQRLEDIRLLKLEIKKLRREKNILTKSVANVEDLR